VFWIDQFIRTLGVQLVDESVLVIVCLTALVLSIKLRKSRPRQCLLVMLASVISFVRMAGVAAGIVFWLPRSGLSLDAATLIFSIVNSIAAAIPYVLLLVAALSRSAEQTSAFPVQVPPPFADQV